MIENGITIANPQQLIEHQINHNWRPSILNLNDDCLLHICHYLNLVDIIRFSATCERIKHITKLYCYKKYKNLHSKQFLLIKPLQLKVMLSKIGNYVNSFIVSANELCKNNGSHWTFLQIINKGCPNLENLILNNIECDSNSNNKSYLFPNLKQLKLFNCIGSFDNFLKTNCNLQRLYIDKNELIDGAILKYLNKLKEVSFVDCSNLYPPYVGELFVKNNIKSFTLISCVKFEDSSRWFRDSVDYTGSLVYFHTNHELFKRHGAQTQIYQIERATKLIKFHIPKLLEDVVNIITNLAIIDKLVDLDMSHCMIKDKKIGAALQYFTKLEILNLNNNVNVNDELLIKLAKSGNLRQLHCRGSVKPLLCIYNVVELSSNLETLEIDEKSLDFVTTKSIINMLINQPNRPKLEILIDSALKLAIDDLVIIF